MSVEKRIILSVENLVKQSILKKRKRTPIVFFLLKGAAVVEKHQKYRSSGGKAMIQGDSFKEIGM